MPGIRDGRLTIDDCRPAVYRAYLRLLFKEATDRRKQDAEPEVESAPLVQQPLFA